MSLLLSIIIPVIIITLLVILAILSRGYRIERTISGGHTRSDDWDSEKVPVQVSVVAPEKVLPRRQFLLEVVFHIESYEVVTCEGYQVDSDMISHLALKTGTQLTVTISPVNEGTFEIDRPLAELTWHPPAARCRFLLHGLTNGAHFLRVEVWHGETLLAGSYTGIQVDAGASKVPPLQNRTLLRVPRSAFASYSQKDKVRVADRVIALQTIGIDIFMDCLDIRQGDNWRSVLEQNLLTRDVLLLFWSQAAKESEWVEKEWRFALTNKGDRAILPNALEHVGTCAPPPELKHLQFSSSLNELREKWSAEAENL